MEKSRQVIRSNNPTLYDIYDRLCKYQRGLGVLLFGEQIAESPDVSRFAYQFSGTPKDHRFVAEFKSVTLRIKRLEKILTLHYDGEWEFLELAKNVVLTKDETPSMYICKRVVSSWHKENDKERYEALLEYQRKRYAEVKQDPYRHEQMLEDNRRWRKKRSKNDI